MTHEELTQMVRDLIHAAVSQYIGHTVDHDTIEKIKVDATKAIPQDLKDKLGLK